MSLSHNAYLVLPRLRVQNFNTLSSPMTWGAPSITAAVGFMYALQRKIPFDWQIDLLSIGMVIHEFQPQVNGSFVKKFNLTRNPLGKDGKTPGIIEEGRAHATISLVIGAYIGGNLADPEALTQCASSIYQQAQTLRFAGGSLLPNATAWHQPDLFILGENQHHQSAASEIKRSLLPGFALISRDDVLTQHTQTLQAENPELTALDAWLDLSRLNKRYRSSLVTKADGQSTEQFSWQTDRPAGSGWLVPIPIGYSALSELYPPGEVDNARDPNVPFRFVESLYSIGEWRSPHRLSSLDELLWYATTDHQAGIYRCYNHNTVQQ
ncbi:type I-F CRISPR-associated protein Csy2 [Thiopseudomonas alkaliphila]|uniref:type I-F CRISPR-associated protein Csy2 n=1 Tax=Thiopseudomonas alkaliphila TaxID=1697053 RepID=UPI002575C134|nr:type I-F CRISPR-associated protein Csy2 [Thiopseudomonas alkaliphila]MDM1708110.1 type I-F CRISPR-associated protein Csy2 [Thiopseudomonas alkaliphila]